MPDPADVEGTEDDKRRAFDDTLLVISRRLDLLLALPIEKLSRLALEHRIKAIGAVGATEPTSPTA
jgi:arsenate reductase